MIDRYERLRDELVFVDFHLRHLPSVQNIKGHGAADTPLADGQAEHQAKLLRLLDAVGRESIDVVVTGNLKRHRGTAQALFVDGVKNPPLIWEDELLNAVMSGPLLEKPAEETEEEYNLDRFRPNNGDLYEGQLADGTPIRFDPAQLGIFPFDPLYSLAYFDKDLRELVFPRDNTLPKFNAIEAIIIEYQDAVIYNKWLSQDSHGRQSGNPFVMVTVGSCSTNAFGLELSKYGTIGENLVTPDYEGVLRPTVLGVENNPMFPQDYGQLSVFGYTSNDRFENRPTLRVVEGNVDIDNLVFRL